jgi:transposase
MASLDKQSIREEITRIKSSFDALSTEGKLSPEARALLDGLFLLVELILSIFMERQTKKTSRNSGIPSSQTKDDNSSVSHPGSNGKGRNIGHGVANNHRTVETVAIATVTHCDVCGESLEDTPCMHHERRTKIDIVFEKVVEHVDAEVKQCPSCETTVKGQFPVDMHGPLQYGFGIKAFIINLIVCQMVALNRVQNLVVAMIGTVISEATMLRFVMNLYHALEEWENKAIDQLLTSQSLHVDETSMKVDQKKHWIHVYSSGEITVKFLHQKRGKKAIEDIDIIPRYDGTIIHDGWYSYFAYANCRNALCGSHLLRNLTFVIESNGYVWAQNMKDLLKETCTKVSERETKRLTDEELNDLHARYRTILEQGEQELPPIPPKPEGKRGKMAKSDAHNLWERLKKYESAVLRFAHDSHVPFTNNRAERDLRMAKVKQKVSGCFRVEIYAKAYCRISSYLQTMSSKGVNPLLAIQMALAGEVD